MGRITNINIVDSGAEYYSAPVVTISAPNADSETAIATLTIVDGVITLVSVANGGTYYTSTPTVTVTDISYIPIATATATAVLEYKGGGVSSINLDSAGSYYIDVSPADTVLIDSPLTTLPRWFFYEPINGSYIKAFFEPVTFNIDQGINTGTVKFSWYDIQENWPDNYLYQSENFRLKWKGTNTIALDVRSLVTNTFISIWSNQNIVYNPAFNKIEFSWDGDVFSLWVDSALQGYINLGEFDSNAFRNQTFLANGIFSLGDSTSDQYFEALKVFDDLSLYDSITNTSVFSNNIIFSEDLSYTPVQATAVATRNTYGDIQRIDVTNAGSGYYSAPNVTIAAPTGAIENYPIYITANTTIGSVTSFNIVAEGGIIDSANIVITAPTGSKSDFQATAITTIDSITNKIASITITDSGNFYDSATISIGLPAANDFNIGDIVYQELSGGIRMQGEVALWNDSDNKLSLIHIGADDGKFHTFVAGGRILSTRQEYGRTVANKIIISIQEENKISESEQNDYFNELTDFLDFSETNPFGDPS